MALPVRLERTTLWLTVRCSNQLSYGSMVAAFTLPGTKYKIVLRCIVPCIFYFHTLLGESARVELANAGVKVPCLTAWLRLYTEHSPLWMRVNEKVKERKTKAPIRRYCLTGAYNESWITRFYPQNFHVYSPRRQERLQTAQSRAEPISSSTCFVY